MTARPGAVEMAGKTDRGRVRRRNEDELALDPQLGVAVVADGMGGLEDGQLASRLAADAVLELLRGAEPPVGADLLCAALTAANERVRAHGRSRGVLMGTTAVVLAMADSHCTIAHAGDSRAYRFRQGSLSRVTADHSLVQELVDRGSLTPEAARHSPDRNLVTRALGLEPVVVPDCTEVAVAPGDLVLLCTDGLWEMLADQRIADLLGRCGAGRRGLDRCASSLVDAANEAGGLDNITVALVRR